MSGKPRRPPLDSTRILLEDEKGAVRRFLRLEREKDHSVYIKPEVPNPGFLDWTRFPEVLIQRYDDLHLSVHGTGISHLRYRKSGKPVNLATFNLPELKQLDAPTYVLQVHVPALSYYPETTVAEGAKTDLVVRAHLLSAGFWFAVAVGPNMDGKRPNGKWRIPIPGVTDEVQVHGPAANRVGSLYYAVASLTLKKGQPPAAPFEVWAPIVNSDPEWYRPLPAMLPPG